MKLNRLTIWMTMAVTAASLALASVASATNVIDTGGPSAAPNVPPTAVPTGGFNWSDFAAGVAVALALALIAVTVAYAANHRGRLAASH